ncbi:hypothetical protein OG946_21605 [Streptomyces sp. NBC_01808]|uniref:hypothetical protein n=1 Tax=Streptomyces sp. NBC_01808 TaxID=2975947 RepID=UPI002DDC086A|nr:hypothetical protein [Streptomyces sp. NBC_01808]WSA39734.1 hypothetical protein OG946_21605 [Streptomyces sp. NBC_01808]
MAVHRVVHTAKVTPGGRWYGETGHGEDSRDPLDTDRMHFTVARDKQALLRAEHTAR